MNNQNTNTLEEYRKEIDKIDYNIFTLLKQRFEIVENVVEYKKTHNLEIYQKNREEEIKVKISEISQELKLSESFLQDVMELILKESKEIQQQKLNNHK